MAGQRYYGRQRSYGSLSADIEDFIKTSDKRMNALMQSSLFDLVENAQTPTAKGGRMRVDTGFLRASGKGSLTGMPTGPVRGDKKEPGSYPYDSGPISVTLGKMKFGDVFHFGWTANYARYRELYDGFLEGAAQQWHRIVAFNTDSIRQRVK